MLNIVMHRDSEPIPFFTVNSNKEDGLIWNQH